MQNSSFYTLILSVMLLLLLTACSKDEFTKPAQVHLQMELDSEGIEVGARLVKEAGSDENARLENKPKIYIESIQYRVSGLSFEGYRENAENYFFSRQFTEDRIIEVKAGGVAPVFAFDMSQGLYERIGLSLQLSKSTESNSLNPYNESAALIMRGYFLNKRDIQVPLIFVYDFNEVFNYSARNASGANDIAVKQAQATTASISFDIAYWLELINARMLQGASLTEVEGLPSIVISAEENEHIFGLLISRIQNAKGLTFR